VAESVLIAQASDESHAALLPMVEQRGARYADVDGPPGPLVGE
jgi:hypothetical protein